MTMPTKIMRPVAWSSMPASYSGARAMFKLAFATLRDGKGLFDSPAQEKPLVYDLSRDAKLSGPLRDSLAAAIKFKDTVSRDRKSVV